MNPPRRRLLFAAIACALAFPFSPLRSADRLAIVFGNDTYQHADSLSNAVNDALSVAAMLEHQLGFTLVKPPKDRSIRSIFASPDSIWKDSGIDRFYQGLEAFKKEAATAQIGLVYYAGHGLEIDGANYLMPVDAELAEPAQLRSQAVKVSEILADLKATGLPAKLLILDCCRNNPLAGRTWTRSRTKGAAGLATIADTELPEASMILFSAGPGQKALDGEGGNSPFTAALVKELPQPGRSAYDAFLKVSDTVMAQTGKKQEPWLKFDGAGRTFRAFQFVAGNAPDNSVTTVNPVPTGPDPQMAAITAELEKVRKLREEAERKAAAAAIALANSTPGSFSTAPDISRGFTNTLGMKFVPVPGTDVLWCEHETRVMDYATYAAANPGVNMAWKNAEYRGHRQAPDHPVVNVSWEDAKAFCAWLSAEEGRTYRLPTDHEWSIAVGIGQQEDPKASPESKNGKVSGYPWGTAWPPPAGYGNYNGEEDNGINGYRDQNVFTAPVKSYRATNGLFDLSGNVWEWCEDWYSGEQSARVLRGGSWDNYVEFGLRSSYRLNVRPALRIVINGFRCVVSPAR